MKILDNQPDPQMMALVEQNQQLAAVIGLLVKMNDDEDFKVPYDVVEEGLPANKGVHIEFNQDEEVMVIGVREIPE